MLTYDDAVFLQICKEKALEGLILTEHVVEAIMRAIPDTMALVEPDRLDELQEYLRTHWAPQLQWMLDTVNLKIVH